MTTTAASASSNKQSYSEAHPETFEQVLLRKIAELTAKVESLENQQEEFLEQTTALVDRVIDETIRGGYDE